MRKMKLRSGIRVVLNGHIYSLHRMVDDDIWQLEEVSTRRIVELNKTQLLEMFSKKEMAFQGQEASEYAVPLEKIASNTELTDKAKLRYAYVKAIDGLPTTKRLLEPVIRKTWEKIGEGNPCPGVSTVCRWSKKFREGHRSTVRLVDQFHRRGNRASRYPKEVLDLSKDAIDDIYMKLERNTAQTTLDEAQRLVIRENKRRPVSDQLPLPSRRFIHSLIQSIPERDRHIARYGHDAAMKLFRSMLGHRITDLPLERAEIDHTPLDVFVVDDETGMPLGRPFLTACIDDNTRCVLGVHIGFSPPSYLSVAKCLQHAFLPKYHLRSRNPDLDHDWESFGVMRELVVDNGAEFHSESLENACFMLSIEIHYSARKTPWFKGIIERFLGSLNRGVAHGNPGTTFSDIFEKGDYDPKKNAVIRLDALRRAINIWIVDYYHQKPHRVTKVSPADAWRSRISVEDIEMPPNQELMDAIVGKSGTRVLTHKGIEYNTLFYNSPEMSKLRMRFGTRLEVEVRINKEDIGQIHVISPDKRTTYLVPAINQKYAQGMTEWQHELCKKYARRHLHRYDDPSSWLEAKAKIREIFREEKQWKKKVTRKAKAESNNRPANTSYEESHQPPSPVASLPAPSANEGQPRSDALSSSSVLTSQPKRFGSIQQQRHQYFIQQEQEPKK